MQAEKTLPKRVCICGCSGSGKSTLGRQLAGRIGIPHTELDALFHGPNWTECPRPEFAEKVRLVTSGDTWIVDGNYSYVRDLTFKRADTIVFLDYPYALVWWRVVKRTFGRAIRREILWNGNREIVFRALFTRDSIIWWMMTTWQKRHQDAIASETNPELEGKTILRFTNPRETEAWLHGF